MPFLPDRLASDLTPKARKRIYRAGVALVLIAVGRGVIKGDEGDLWMLVLAAALGVANTHVPADK